MEPTNTTEEAGNKTAKNYEVTMKKLIAVMGGEKNLLPDKKISQNAMELVVEELLKEKKETTVKQVKDGLKMLLDKHIELKRSISDKKKELEKLENDKMKEFTEAANKLFGQIDNLADIEKSYYDGLNTATKGPETPTS